MDVRGSWSMTTVSELAHPTRHALNGGPFGSKLVSRMYVDEGVPVIRGGNLPFDKRFHDNDFVFVTEQKARELIAHSAKPGDVIFTQRGSLGQVGIIPYNARWPLYIISQSQMKLTVDGGKANASFIYYAFRHDSIKKSLIGLASSSGVPHINLDTLRNFRIPLPPLREQIRIAECLSAYDDLIENNTRRIEILEEMARRLFDEWFVQFRYSGNAERQPDSPLPEGWRRVPIREAYEGLFDGPHATPSPSQDGPVFLGIGNITESGRLDLSSVRHISEVDFPKWTKRVTPQEGDIVFTYEATLNRYALIPPGFRGCLGRRLALIRVAPERRHNLFLYYYFFSAEWRQVIAANILSGATVDRIPLTTFPEFPINLPPDELVQRFDAVVRPMVRQIQVLSRQNEILRAARDLLLPKLISGEINVGDAPLPGELAAE